MNFEEHLAALAVCRLCPNVLGSPVVGAVADARVLLVGQAPGPREMEQHRPFAFTAGRRLFSWFERLGVGEDEFRKHVYMAAVIRCFPGRDPKAGGDRVPAPDEIANCGAHLDREIALLAPRLVIAVGTLAAQALGVTPSVSEGPGGAGAATPAATARRPPDQAPRSARGDIKLKDVVGRIHRVARAGKRFDVVVLPHPSGRSTWTNKPENAKLLERSLALIGAHAAWRKTFGAR